MHKWQKLGQLFCPEPIFPWMQTHASTPTVEKVNDTHIRIFFSTRDEQNRSSITYLEISDLLGDRKLSDISPKPTLTFGAPGLFDDSGVSVSAIQSIGNKKYLYYLGWNLAKTVPWRNSIGLAVSTDGVTYEKYSQAPIMDRSKEDPYSISYSWVMPIQGELRMWYGTNLSWGPNQQDMKHVIKTARSDDGINWKRDNSIAINLKSIDEYAISRPCILFHNGIYKMWFSHRGESYRIGYAESKDSVTWERKDHLSGITPSSSGWDSTMICYPYIFEYQNQILMIYNGNDYGKTGFGLARLET